MAKKILSEKPAPIRSEKTYYEKKPNGHTRQRPYLGWEVDVEGWKINSIRNPDGTLKLDNKGNPVKPEVRKETPEEKEKRIEGAIGIPKTPEYIKRNEKLGIETRGNTQKGLSQSAKKSMGLGKFNKKSKAKYNRELKKKYGGL